MEWLQDSNNNRDDKATCGVHVCWSRNPGDCPIDNCIARFCITKFCLKNT